MIGNYLKQANQRARIFKIIFLFFCFKVELVGFHHKHTLYNNNRFEADLVHDCAERDVEW